MDVCADSTVYIIQNKLENRERVLGDDKLCIDQSWLCTQIQGKQFYMHHNHEITAFSFLSNKAIYEGETWSNQRH